MRNKSNKSSSVLIHPGIARATPAIIAVSLIVVALPGFAVAQTAGDSAAICAQVEAYQNVWNTHNPNALAAFFTEDADFVMGNLPAVQGRQEIRDWWQGYFARQESGRHLTLDVSPVRFIAAGVGVINVVTTTGGHDDQDQELKARRFRGTWLWHRLSSQWLISSMCGLPTEQDSVVLTASVETAESLRPHIRAFVDAYENAFNAHDPIAVSTFFRNDADIIVRNSPVVHGARAIRDWWNKYFSLPRPYKALLIIDKIRTISKDVALIYVISTGVVGKAEYKPRPLRQTRAMWVLVRENGEWFIAALRVLPGEADRLIRKGGN